MDMSESFLVVDHRATGDALQQMSGEAHSYPPVRESQVQHFKPSFNWPFSENGAAELVADS